jgi:hypothetical protein
VSNVTTFGSPSSSEHDRRAIDTRIEGDRLFVTVRKEFDSGYLRQDWAHSLVTLHPGPFAHVQLDLSQVGLLSSTFFSGLIQLHQHYMPRGCIRITLHWPDHRVSRNLKTLRLDSLFNVIPRPAGP